jgi:protein-tyrosine kinase
MSKFFDETQKAHQWATKTEGQTGLDIRAVLDTLRKGENVAADMLDTRLQGCRKISLSGCLAAPAALLTHAGKDAQAGAEAYRTLRTRLMRIQSGNGLRSVMITSPLPGEGKTITVLNLALCWAQLRNTRVLAIDGDLRSRGMTRLLGVPEGPGLADVLTGESDFESALVATEHENLFVVSAGFANGVPAELFTGTRWAEFLGWCAESFSIILVDSPPIEPLTDTELISAGCDGVLFVVKALATSRDVAKSSAQRIDRKKLLGVVLNGLSSGSGRQYRHYGSQNGHATSKA